MDFGVIGAIISLMTNLIVSVIFGYATQQVNRQKGYSSNWFWWGFFFGIIAFVIACARPETAYYPESDDDYEEEEPEYYGYIRRTSSMPAEKTVQPQKLPGGRWLCRCGRENAPYVSSCSCGRNQRDVFNPEPPKVAPALSELTDEQDKALAIREYKKLLDDGIISEEEFEAKKKQLLS